MKKIVALFIIIIITLVGIVVYVNINNNKTDIANKELAVKPSNPYYKLSEENKNYKVYTDESGFNYYYDIYNNNGKLIDTGFHTKGIGIEVIGDILNIRKGAGTYVFTCKYYDLSTNRVSRDYATPLEIGGEYIAYFTTKTEGNKDEIVLIVQNIFDERLYYKEIKRDFSDETLSFYSPTEFIDNNTKLRIKYPINQNDEVVTETIDL